MTGRCVGGAQVRPLRPLRPPQQIRQMLRALQARRREMPSGMAAQPATPAGSRVMDLLIRQVQRVLGERSRYRYVKPRVLREGEGVRIESPCCSRNIDRSGGVIDIALLQPGTSRGGRGWTLYARDHTAGCWAAQAEDEALQPLLALLCQDPQRVFWP
ncbi:hypothetical protein [Curvibacter lanceolatus]|jgi:hypothetical protein|uniref:DUF3024 domain-containing protein n=1 Tax=Curvibacter lanceolatus TaxID=86182 RepID=UPI00036E4D2C|nr:hypothetical protein [Curvibacter lanceolatus]